MATIKIPHKLLNELWWLIISVDFDYSRIAIADHEISGDHITFWLGSAEQDQRDTFESTGRPGSRAANRSGAA